MNILITGIHGFVGSNLVASLKKGHTIYGRDIVDPEKEGVVRTFAWEDLNSPELPKFDAIIHLARKAHIWRIPRGLMNGCAKVGGWLHLPLNPMRMQKLTENYVVSNAKIKKALGIEKMPVAARDGLIATIKSFAKQG